MPTPLTRPTDPATESSILLLRQDLYDQHAATYALLENILGASQDLQQDYMEDIYHFLEESIPNQLNDIILALSPIQNSLSFQSSIQNDMHQLLSGYVMGELQALNLSLNVIATRLQSILDATPSEGGGVDLTTVEARLQSILDAIGSSGTWTLRGVLDWWRHNFEDFDGSLAPYRMLARQKNIYEALTGQGASNHGDDYLYGKVQAIYEALTDEDSGADLSTIESRLQAILDAMPSGYATEATLIAIGAAMPSDPATESTLAALQTILEQIRTSSSSTAVNTSDAATETTLTAIRAALPSGYATEATLAAALAKLSDDPATNATLSNLATEATLLLVLAGLPADYATETTLAAIRSHTAQISANTDTIITNNAANAHALLEDTDQLVTNTDTIITNNAANAAALLAAIQECCDAESTCIAPPADLCQRAQWAVEELRQWAIVLASHKDSFPTPYDQNTITSQYQTRLEVTLIGQEYTGLYTNYAALFDEDALCSGGTGNNQYNKVATLLFDHKDALVNAIALAADSCAVKAAWDAVIDGLTLDCIYIGLFAKWMLVQSSIDGLYNQSVPGDATELSSYDNTACGAA